MSQRCKECDFPLMYNPCHGWEESQNSRRLTPEHIGHCCWCFEKAIDGKMDPELKWAVVIDYYSSLEEEAK